MQKKTFKEILSNPEVKVDVNVDIKNAVMFAAGLAIGIIFASGKRPKIYVIK